MYHLYRLQSGFIARFNVSPQLLEHTTATSADGHTYHVLSSAAEEHKLFVFQCDYLNSKYDTSAAEATQAPMAA